VTTESQKIQAALFHAWEASWIAYEAARDNGAPESVVDAAFAALTKAREAAQGASQSGGREHGAF